MNAITSTASSTPCALTDLTSLAFAEELRHGVPRARRHRRPRGGELAEG